MRQGRSALISEASSRRIGTDIYSEYLRRRNDRQRHTASPSSRHFATAKAGAQLCACPKRLPALILQRCWHRDAAQQQETQLFSQGSHKWALSWYEAVS